MLVHNEINATFNTIHSFLQPTTTAVVGVLHFTDWGYLSKTFFYICTTEKIHSSTRWSHVKFKKNQKHTYIYPVKTPHSSASSNLKGIIRIFEEKISFAENIYSLWKILEKSSEAIEKHRHQIWRQPGKNFEPNNSQKREIARTLCDVSAQHQQLGWWISSIEFDGWCFKIPKFKAVASSSVR